MPQVPVLDAPQVQPEALRPVFQQNIDVSSGLQQGARALDQAADTVFNAQMQKARADAWQADADLKTQFGKFQADLQTKMQGGNAAGGQVDPTTGEASPGYAAQVEAWFKQKQSELGQNLAPAQRALVSRSLAMYSAARVDEAYRWQKTQTMAAEHSAFEAAKQATVDSAIKSNDPNSVPGAVDTIQQQNAQWAQAHGIVSPDGTPDPNWLRMQNERDLTALHAGMVEQLQRSNPTQASEYLAKYQSQITPEVFLRLRNGVQEAGDNQAGMVGANEVWASQLPPGADATVGATVIPVDKMLAAVQQKFAGNPVALRAAEAQIAQNYKAWQETSQNAQRAYKSALLAAYNGGGGLQQMQAMPEWQKLDGDTREQITEHLQNYQDRRLARQVTLANLQDRQYAIADRAKSQKSFGQYIDLMTNPEKLASMTPDDVQALRLTMGDEQVLHIAELRQKLGTAADVKTARIDNDTFNAIATNEFGLKAPNEPGASKDDKFRYAQLRTNVDYVLQQMQQAKKLPLTMDEKAAAMRQELARQVTVNPGWFSANKQVPVVALTPDQAKQVVVPDEQRGQIVQALQTMAAQHPGDPRFAPTEDNVRALYLRKTSPAGRLFNGH